MEGRDISAACQLRSSTATWVGPPLVGVSASGPSLVFSVVVFGMCCHLVFGLKTIARNFCRWGDSSAD